jgi:hypothetical protein
MLRDPGGAEEGGVEKLQNKPAALLRNHVAPKQ